MLWRGDFLDWCVLFSELLLFSFQSFSNAFFALLSMRLVVDPSTYFHTFLFKEFGFGGKAVTLGLLLKLFSELFCLCYFEHLMKNKKLNDYFKCTQLMWYCMQGALHFLIPRENDFLTCMKITLNQASQTCVHKCDSFGYHPHQRVHRGHSCNHPGHLDGNWTHAHKAHRPRSDH